LIGDNSLKRISRNFQKELRAEQEMEFGRIALG
jgi:hypothetical protein